ncbi:hypothetical protein BX666DRAFT_1924263 [Dichotomocladium elegans]|nr:hypothetical protein BX666DRAFT_1924263 [Dichotomocladium elegans]
MSFKVAARYQHTSKLKISSASSSSSSASSYYLDDDVDDVDEFIPRPRACRSSTLALAQFLATTGPEEFSQSAKTKTKHARILDKLRGRGSQSTAEEWVKFWKQNLRDSGVYSEVISDKALPAFDVKGHHADLNLFPKPPSVVPTQPTFPHQQQQQQKKNKKKQKQEKDEEGKLSGKENSCAGFPSETKAIEVYMPPSIGDRDRGACPHCRQILPLNITREHQQRGLRHRRRLSCPPALAGNDPCMDQQAMLRDKIARLEAQLIEERQSRKRLEEAICAKAGMSCSFNL